MNHSLVVNCRRDPFDVYIGRSRSKGMHFGNPFIIGTKLRHSDLSVATRSDVILAFKDWLEGKDFHDVEPDRLAWIIKNVRDLKGKRLGCFCAPQACHGHVYCLFNEQITLKEFNAIVFEKPGKSNEPLQPDLF